MPRGRKRKIAEFIPRAWIPNSSSEDEHHQEVGIDHGAGGNEL